MFDRNRLAAIALGMTLLQGNALSQPAENEPSPSAIEQKQEAGEEALKAQAGASTAVEVEGAEGDKAAAQERVSDGKWYGDSDAWWLLGDNPAQSIMAWAAIAATFLTFIGVLLLGATLYYTRRAAIEAASATSAANDTVDVTRKIGIAQTRSYISVIDGGYILNKSGYSGWVDIVNKGYSPAIDVEAEFSIGIEVAWFGGGAIGSSPPPFNIEKKVAKKPKIQPGEISRFYFVWTKDQLEEHFSSLNNERFTVVVSCVVGSKTIYPEICDSGHWQLTNYPGFVRSTERSLVADGRLYVRQLQRQ